MLLRSGGSEAFREGVRGTQPVARSSLVGYSELAHMAPSPLDYVPMPESFRLPAHVNFGGTSGIGGTAGTAGSR